MQTGHRRHAAPQTPHHNHVSTLPGPSIARLFARPPVLMGDAPQGPRHLSCPPYHFPIPAAPPLAAGSTPRRRLHPSATAPARSEAGTTPRSPWGTLLSREAACTPPAPLLVGAAAGREGRERLTWGGAAGPWPRRCPSDPWRLRAAGRDSVSQRAPRRWTRPLPAAARGPAPSGPGGAVGSAAGGARGGAGRRRGALGADMRGAVSAAPRGLGSPPRRGAPRTKARTGRGRSAGTPVAFARPARGRPRSRSGPTSKGRRGAATAGPEDRGGGGERTGRTHPVRVRGAWGLGQKPSWGPGAGEWRPWAGGG